MTFSVDVQLAVAAEFGVTHDDIISASRAAPLVKARHAAMFLVREQTALSLPQIGYVFGARDHTTILHGIVRTTERLREDAELAERLDRIRVKLLRTET